MNKIGIDEEGIRRKRSRKMMSHRSPKEGTNKWITKKYRSKKIRNPEQVMENSSRVEAPGKAYQGHEKETRNGGQTGGQTGGQAVGTGGQTGRQTGGTGLNVPQGGNVFAMLRNHPLFIQMRALVQSNPQYLEQLLNNISENSPELFQIIQQNQDQFVQFLNEPVSQQQLQQALASTLGINPGSQGGTGTGTGTVPGIGTGTVPGGNLPPQNPGGRGAGGQRQIQVQLTPQEIESVNNVFSFSKENFNFLVSEHGIREKQSTSLLYTI